MSIVSSGASGITGGMFGCVRIGKDPICDSLHKYHGGIDFACPLGTNVFSMRGGFVYDIRDTFDSGEYAEGSLGNYVIIRFTTDEGTYVDYTYAHLTDIYVTKGSTVTGNTIIASSGNTGNAAYPGVVNHLHVEIERNGVREDPAQYFASIIAPDGSISSPCDPYDPIIF